MPMPSQYKQHIIDAQRQVREDELRVAQQEAIVALLTRDGLDSSEPRRLLITFNNTLARARKRLQRTFER
jgi:hypothetical protein